MEKRTGQRDKKTTQNTQGQQQALSTTPMNKGLDKEQWLIGSVHQWKARTNQQPTNQCTKKTSSQPLKDRCWSFPTSVQARTHISLYASSGTFPPILYPSELLFHAWKEVGDIKMIQAYRDLFQSCLGVRTSWLHFLWQSAGNRAEGEGGGGIFLTSTATDESPQHPLSPGGILWRVGWEVLVSGWGRGKPNRTYLERKREK